MEKDTRVELTEEKVREIVKEEMEKGMQEEKDRRKRFNERLDTILNQASLLGKDG